MTNELIKLIMGFVLTTLCGALLGFIFQRRHARYQWLRSRWEKELEEAQTVFEEVSRLLDRRLYRTRQLLWAIDRKPEVRQERLSEYRTVVTEWNDNINRILALVAIHYTDNLRNVVDNKIGAEFVAIGHQLERAIKSESKIDTKQLEQRVNQLAAQVYGFNLNLLKEIKARRNTLTENA
jgi:hypothetical protein